MIEFKETFQLSKPRDFGAILADVAVMIYRNWQTLLLALAYVTLPFIVMSFLVYFISFANLSQEAIENIFLDYIPSFAVLAVLLVFAGISTQLVAIAYVYTVKRLGMVKFEPIALWHTIQPKWQKILLTYAIMWFAPLVVLALCGMLIFMAKVLGIILLIIAVFGYIWFITGAMYAGYVAMDTDLSPIDCIKQALELVNAQWWETFGYLILLSIVINAVHGVIFMPFTVMELIKNFSAISSGNAENLQKTTLSLLSMFQMALMILFMCFSAFCYNLKYYDLCENKYGYNTLQRINRIGSHLTEDEDI